MKDNKIDYPFQYYFKSIVCNIKKSIDKHLKPYKISSQQARVIGLIYEKQLNGITPCQKDIELWLGITGASVTSLLQGLERKGFIKRTTKISDERTKELSLQKKGQDLIDTFVLIFKNTEKKIKQGMTDEQKENYLELLKLISENFKE